MFSSRFVLGCSKRALPVLVGASLMDSHLGGRQSFKTVSRLEKKQQDNNNDKGEVFTKSWDKLQEDFWKSSIFTEKEEETKEEEEEDHEPVKPHPVLSFEEMAKAKLQKFWESNKKKPEADAAPKKDEDSAGSFQEMAAGFASLLAGGGSEESVQRIVKQARESAEAGDVADTKSLEELLKILQDLKTTADKFLGEVDLTKLYPTSLFYFVEHEDAVKNPSWKRRMHRFFPGIDIGQMERLNDFLQLADLSYADSVEEIQEGLEQHPKTPYEVVLVDTNSTPHRPAHFIAVQRRQPIFSPYLEILLCVRGTKTIEDALADILCDYQEYRGGQAHSGVLGGGQRLAAEHKALLLKLLKSSGKHKIRLTCVGHSLGAGCASIVGMELYDDPRFEVEVIGFGCPALLSKELSEQTKGYITTVVADDDCVPRLSAATLVNALLDIMEYNYLPSARRDVRHAFQELQRLFPALVTTGLSDTVIEFLNPLIGQYLGEAIKEPTSKRMEPTLFPPGNIIHFYRDGVGVTGSVVPCDYFDELIVSRRMVDDHLFFTGYQQIFLELMRQHHRDHNFTFDASEKDR